ncbi:hypothetical protein [Streptomyces sp. NPDC059134]|uniref:hypothetical protein n=1 Tax=Streptomyces sp. NPDC059134 TaxID=3346738 RepID=UPI0036B730E5
MALLTGLGACAWNTWKEDQREAECQPHRTQALALSDKAQGVGIPLVFAGDPSVSILQLGGGLPGDLIRSVDAASVTELDVSAAYSEKRDIAGQAARIVLAHQDCFDAGIISDAARIDQAPTTVSRVEMPSPAHCGDGWPSGSIGRPGACSHHNGVVRARPWATLLFD